MLRRVPSAPLPVDGELPDLSAHIPALDGLRAISVLLVLLGHCSVFIPQGAFDTALRSTLRAGWCGVDSFFVLSGFLITGILYNTKGERGYFRSFFGRRMLRILPVYYAYLIVLFYVLPAVFSLHTADWQQLRQDEIYYWTYTVNVAIALDGSSFPTACHTAHFWSLSVEENFYLLWPLVIYFCSRRRAMWVCGLCVLGSWIARIIMTSTGFDAFSIYTLTFTRLDGLALGSLVALGVRGMRDRTRYLPAARLVLVTSGVGMLAIALTQGGLFNTNWTVMRWGYTGVALFFAALLYLLISTPRGHWLTRLMSAAALRSIGRHSYAIYVVHFGIVGLVEAYWFRITDIPTLFGSHLPGVLVNVLVCTGLSFVVAKLIWHGMEKHCLRLKKHFQCGARTGSELITSRPPAVPSGQQSAAKAV